MVIWNTTDIPELVEFEWYHWVYYRDATTSFTLPEEEIGKYLGTSDNIGSKMIMWILKQNGEIVSRTTLRTLTVMNLLARQKIKRETSLPRLSTKRLVPPCMTLA